MEVMRDLLGRFIAHRPVSPEMQIRIKKAHVGTEGKLGDALAESNVFTEKARNARIEITMRGIDSRGRKIRKRLTVRLERKRHHTHFASMLISRINEELFYNKGFRLSYPATVFKVKRWSHRKVCDIMTRAKWNRLEQVQDARLTIKIVPE